MNNFRRTVTEVVYIVKVTTHTIQKRLEEFKLTPSSGLTVEDFLNNELLESQHDPPSFYRKSEEFLKNKKTRKRKRIGDDAVDGEEEGENNESEEAEQNKRSKTVTPNLDAVPAVEPRQDADGFAIPALPTQAQNQDINIDPSLSDDLAADYLDKLYDTVVEEEDNSNITESTSPPKASRGRQPDLPVHVPQEWAQDEAVLEGQISELISDPNTQHHAISYANAVKRSQRYMQLLQASNPSKEISMDVHIGEDEFADDPEVINCMLSPEDVAKKEKVWVNENKAWLRKQQIKQYQRRLAENGPPKATRNRKKKPRIGELQTSPASTPGDAAVAALKERTWSKKVNYEALRDLFDDAGDELGSAGTSRATSRAGSTVADESVPGSPSADTQVDEDEEGDEDDYVRSDSKASANGATSNVAPSVADSEDQADDWRTAMRQEQRKHDNNEDVAEEGEEDYDDYQGYGAEDDMADVEADMNEMFEGDDDYGDED